MNKDFDISIVILRLFFVLILMTVLALMLISSIDLYNAGALSDFSVVVTIILHSILYGVGCKFYSDTFDYVCECYKMELGDI